MNRQLKKLRRAAQFRLRKKTSPVIGLVVSSFDKGGLEQVVLNLYRGYRQAGSPAYILVEQNILGAMAAEVPPQDIFVFDRNEDAFLAFCFSKGINTLHYHYNTYMMRGARWIGFRILYTIHNIYTWKSEAEMQAYAALLQNAHCLVAVSSFVKDYFCTRTHFSEDRVQVINNGIDLTQLLCDAPCSITRAELGLAPNCTAFAFVASFHPVKHQIGMLGVMEQLRRTDPHIHLLLVGNHGNEAYYRDFCHALEKSPAKENIHLVPYLSHVQMGSFLRTVPDAFLLPTLQEGCSNAVLEALCCGLPMVLTDVGNAREVANTGACIIVPPAYENAAGLNAAEIEQLSHHTQNSNTSALVQAMRQMTAELPQRREAARLAAQCSQAYSISAMVQAYLGLMKGTR